jgi:hypothetical protein
MLPLNERKFETTMTNNLEYALFEKPILMQKIAL